MKKVRLFLILLLSTLALLTVVGCKTEDRIVGVALKDHEPESVIEMAVGAFDYGAYSVILTYESGAVEELALTEEMIVEADLFKFYQEGEHDITVSYGNQKYVFKVAVKRSTFGALKFPENNVFSYDGKAHTVEVEGDMPANAIVTYPGGNSFINAGTYDVIAIVSCEGYVTERLATTVKIERARYDLTGITFDAKEFVYDGQTHSVGISGILPEGVSEPTYTIDGVTTASAVNVGEYRVIATFANSNPNYETIPDMETTLKITPAEFHVGEVELVFKNEDGSAINGSQKVYDGLGVRVELNNFDRLSGRGTVSYTIFDQDGKPISLSNKNTNIKNAGVYTVKVEFTLADHKNYKPIAPIERKFEVKKAKYDLSKVHFDHNVVAYDGKTHRLAVELPSDHMVKVEDITYEYYLNGKLVTSGKDASVTNAGEYKVQAIFNLKDENYEVIEPMEATLRIEKTSYNMSQVRFDTVEVVYDGKEHRALVVLPSDHVIKAEDIQITYEYYLNGKLVASGENAGVKDAGQYTVKASFTVKNENCLPIDKVLEATLRILQKV